jgi:hypothetical protein
MRIVLPHTGVKQNSLTKKLHGSGIGSVLLDGGIGGQSSYRSKEDYENTTGVKLKGFSGSGLDDKLGQSLSKLKTIKRKNIVM